MIAMRVRHERSPIVTTTRGRLPPPSASTMSGGTSRPRIFSCGSTIAVNCSANGPILPQVAVPLVFQVLRGIA